MIFSEIYRQYMYSYPHKTAYHALEGIDLRNYLDKVSEKPLSLYVHLPFCESKCGYCNLFSVAGQGNELIIRYLDAIKQQALAFHSAAPALVFDSLTLGGGTPLFLPEMQLERLFEIIEIFFRKENAPVLVETSPGQTTREKLQILKNHKTTRISIGVQSFQDRELAVLRRSHSVSECKQALSLIGQIGFPIRNIDLIYGIPGQDTASFQNSIDTALSYEPEELFLYPLYIKPGTMLYHNLVLSEKHTYGLYQFMVPYLKEHGYEQISMRRFVRKDCLAPSEAFHGCGFEHTLSFGCGGRSYLENLHFCTPYHTNKADCLKEIQRFLSADYLAVEHGYLLSTEERLRRYVIKNLLHRDGISLQEYEKAREYLKNEETENICFRKNDFQKGNPASTHIIFEDFPIFSDLLSDGLISYRIGDSSKFLYRKTLRGDAHSREWKVSSEDNCARKGDCIKQEKFACETLGSKDGRIALTEQGMSLSDAIGPLFISEEVSKRSRQGGNL